MSDRTNAIAPHRAPHEETRLDTAGSPGQESRRPNRFHLGLLCLILLAGAALRLCALGQESLWADEFYSLIDDRHPPGVREILDGVRNQGVQAPYYLMLHGFIRLAGSSDRAMRLPSALLGSATVALIYLVGAALFRRRAPALLAALLLALSPMHIWYSQEARFYALLVFVELLALMALAKGVSASNRSPVRPVWLVISAGLVLLAIEIHIFTIFIWLGFVAVYGWLALRKRISPRLALLLALLAAPGPIRPVMMSLDRFTQRQGLQAFLPDHYTASLVPHVLRAQFLGPHGSPLPGGWQWLGLTIGAALLLTGAWRLWRLRERFGAVGLILMSGVTATLVVPVAISFVKPIIYYGQRYLIIGLPFTILLSCAALALPGSPVPGARWRRGITTLTLAVLLALQVAYLVPHYRYRQKHTWDTVGTALAERLRPGDRIFVVPERSAGLLARYMPPGAPVERQALESNRLPEAGPNARFFIVSYADLRAWLASCGVREPIATMLFETHQPGQGLWIHTIE